MKRIVLLLLSCCLLLHQPLQCIASKKKNTTKATEAGKTTVAAGVGLILLGGGFYLRSLDQEDPITKVLTPRGAGNRLIAIVSAGAGVCTSTIGGIMFAIGKSRDAIKKGVKKRKK